MTSLADYFEKRFSLRGAQLSPSNPNGKELKRLLERMLDLEDVLREIYKKIHKGYVLTCKDMKQIQEAGKVYKDIRKNLNLPPDCMLQRFINEGEYENIVKLLLMQNYHTFAILLTSLEK